LNTQSRAIFELIGQRYFFAPLDNPLKILDVGCGSGVVTLELGRLYPSASIIGIDQAPIVGSRSEKLPNVQFIQEVFHDLVADGTLKPQDFDFVFSRMLVMSLVDWRIYVSAASSLLKPGGWLELQDLSWRLRNKDGEAIDTRYEYLIAIQETCVEKGLDPFAGERLAPYMEKSGLVGVSYRKFPWLWSDWDLWPQGHSLAMHQRSEAHIAVQQGMLDVLLAGRYDSDRLTQFKSELRQSAVNAEPGVHYSYGVSFGQKV